MSQLLIRDLQTQSPGSSLVTLYELEMPDGSTLYFHDGKDSSSADVTFDGNTYEGIPVEFDGVDLTSDGPSSRPTLRIGNVLTVFKDALGTGFTYEDLLGKQFTRRRTLQKYLTSSPAVELPKNIYYVDRIGTTNILSVELELASPFDIEGVKLPSRVVMGGGCSWQYQGASPDLAASAQLGGCTYNRFSRVTVPSTGVTYINYVNSRDEPIVDSAAVIGTWSGSGTVNGIYRTVKSNLTKIENRGSFTTGASAYDYWQMVTSTTSTPTASNAAWRRVWIYSAYSTSGTYNVYTDPNYNDYVTHTLTGESFPRLFKKILVTQAGVAQGSNPAYNKHWELGDICGKRLYSCTRRFQYKNATSNGTTVPSTAYDQTVILPFGGFPGSRTYS